MANIKLKNNYWVTESIYDTTDSKTQKQVNADLHQDIEDTIIVSDTQPSSDANQIWLPQTIGEGVQVPTWAEHQALSTNISNLQDAVDGINKFQQTEIIDVDTETRPLVYYSASSTGTKPFSGIGYLITLIRDPDNAKTQFTWYRGSTEMNVYTRRMLNGVWGDWVIVGANPTTETVTVSISSTDTRFKDTSTAECKRYGNVVMLNITARFDFSGTNLNPGDSVTMTITGAPTPIFTYTPRFLSFQTTNLSIVWMSGTTVTARCVVGAYTGSNAPIAAGIIYLCS